MDCVQVWVQIYSLCYNNDLLKSVWKLFQFILPSRVKSSLFADCLDKKNTIQAIIGTLYLDEDTNYELRIAATEGYTWTEFELPDGASIFDCALTAADEGMLCLYSTRREKWFLGYLYLRRYEYYQMAHSLEILMSE